MVTDLSLPPLETYKFATMVSEVAKIFGFATIRYLWYYRRIQKNTCLKTDTSIVFPTFELFCPDYRGPPTRSANTCIAHVEVNLGRFQQKKRTL